ncbi:hypothetical protein [Vibrio campbellii]|uniref:hypothetical protein n=1 Tax=Vibrio campbellii TaxID=680 RepID=UPI0006810B48|nr:hypothetical protein [Vibrio campbellii]
MESQIITNIIALFKGNTLKVRASNKNLYRGCWLTEDVFPGGLWFKPTLDGAAEYVAMHAQQCRAEGKTPYIFECSLNKDMKFYELHESHLTAFFKAYGRNWTHEELATDIPKAFSAIGDTSVNGFYRPQTGEYFVCDPKKNLNLNKKFTNKEALKEASRVKGHSV